MWWSLIGKVLHPLDASLMRNEGEIWESFMRVEADTGQSSLFSLPFAACKLSTRATNMVPSFDRREFLSFTRSLLGVDCQA